MDAITWTRLPAALRLRPQWVCWRWVDRADPATGELKRTKVPVSPRTGGPGKSTDPATWAPFGVALRACRADATLGLGFVFAPGGGLVGVDLDGCRDAATGALTPFAWEVVTALDSYTEVTPSGTGLHILVAGTLPGARRQRKAPGANIELYPDGRFFTMTGDWLPVTPATVEDRTAALGALYGTLFPPEPDPPPVAVPQPQRVIVAGSRHITDPQAVTKALADAQQRGLHIGEIVSGMAAGVDTQAVAWAKAHNIPTRLFPADWEQHGRAAGPLRNAAMAAYADTLVAIWDGTSRGTADMIAQARTKHLTLFVYRYQDGAVTLSETTARPVAAPGPGLADTAILRIASNAANGAKFRSLMRGDTTGYASESEADAALLALLAFYTSDPAQLERLFNLSALNDRKWQDRPAYRARTLALALRGARARFGERRAA